MFGAKQKSDLANPSSVDPPTVKVIDLATDGLRFINSYRARHGQRALDPDVSGWSDADIMIEARRLGWMP
jgi:hypothetical protein